MRTIKFRGKCIKSGDLVYGDLIHGVGHKEGNTYILPSKLNLAYVKHCDPLDGVMVDPETVGEFTGILDKTGTEIYEGDIFLNGESKRIIEFEGGCFHAIRPDRSATILLSFIVDNPKNKVIGNIHQNPELL